MFPFKEKIDAYSVFAVAGFGNQCLKTNADVDKLDDAKRGDN